MSILSKLTLTTTTPNAPLTPLARKRIKLLNKLDQQIAGEKWLFKDGPSLADMAILPFVRQFAFIDKAWFDAQPWPDLQEWLERFLASDQFAAIMDKYSQWVAGDAPVYFP